MKETTCNNIERTRVKSAMVTLIVVSGALLLARLALAMQFDLFPDEALYAWLAEHAPFGFTPHPPGVPLLIRAGTSLFGKTELGVRIFPLLLTTLSLVPLYLLARDIGGERTAFWSVITAAAVPSYFAFGAVTTPDGTQLFFWALALYFTFKALETSRLSWWIFAGVTIGIGLYVKYIIILYYPSLALCLLLSLSWRSHLRSRGLYLSVAVAFLVFALAAVWHEYSTHWDALCYHLRERQTLQPPTLKGIATYQALHAGYLSPLLYFGLLAAMIWAGVQGRAHGECRLLFLFSFSAVTYVFFLAIAAVTRRVLYREQWDAPAYLSALIAAVIMTQTWLTSATSERRRKVVRTCAALSLALGILLSALYVLEGVTGLGSRLTGSRPRFTKLIGWHKMAGAADRQFASLPSKADAFFLGETFPCALEYAFYGRQTQRIYTLDPAYSAKYGLVEVLRGIDASQSGLARELGRNAVYVAEAESDPRAQTSDELRARKQELRQAFASVEEVPPVAVVRHGKAVKWFRVLRCIKLSANLRE